MQWDSDTQEHIDRVRAEDRTERYVNSWRVVCGGVVTDQTPARHGRDFAVRMCSHFADNICGALIKPDWVFDGSGGRQSAKEWIEHHEKRLGTKLSLDLRIVPPGEVLPLCSGLISG